MLNTGKMTVSEVNTNITPSAPLHQKIDRFYFKSALYLRSSVFGLFAFELQQVITQHSELFQVSAANYTNDMKIGDLTTAKTVIKI